MVEVELVIVPFKVLMEDSIKLETERLVIVAEVMVERVEFKFEVLTVLADRVFPVKLVTVVEAKVEEPRSE